MSTATIDVPEVPTGSRVNYLNAQYGVKSWLLTTDHKRIALLYLVSITLMYLCGLMMRGAMFQPQNGDLLTILINTGGFIGDLANGILYLLTVWLGYNQPDMAGAVHDYGTKFLVTAGLLNILAMVDAFEIAAGRKS